MVIITSKGINYQHNTYTLLVHGVGTCSGMLHHRVIKHEAGGPGMFPQTPLCIPGILLLISPWSPLTPRGRSFFFGWRAWTDPRSAHGNTPCCFACRVCCAVVRRRVVETFRAQATRRGALWTCSFIRTTHQLKEIRLKARGRLIEGKFCPLVTIDKF